MEGKRNSRLSKKVLVHSDIFGLCLTVGVNVVALAVLYFSFLAPPDPPVPPSNLPVEFLEDLPVPQEEELPEREIGAPEEHAEDVPVQRSEAPVKVEKDSGTKEATVGNKGDVEVPKPEEEIDNEAIFRSPKNKKQEKDADHGAKQASDKFNSGSVDGNAKAGVDSGNSSASLYGRSIRGRLPEPKYDIQESGTVVVQIFVDNDGNVTNAIPGAKGTTITNRSIWNAAKEAAMKAKFNVDSTAPGLQEGTITYKFILN